MQTLTKYLIAIILSLFVAQVSAQDTIQDQVEYNKKTIEALKQKIESQEKHALKLEVEDINKRVVNKEITYEAGEDLKQEAAKKRALNIENRIIILENKAEFYTRNNLAIPFNSDGERKREFGIIIGDSDNFTGVTILNTDPKPVKYDTRTTNDMLFAAGYNNAIVDGKSISDSPYNVAQSRFMEIGWNWKTRLGNSGNAPRIKYGLALQDNRYELEENKYFVQDGNTTTLQTFDENLKLAELRITNLVVPAYFEFGKMRKIEKPDRVRYINEGKFKFGLGGYAGFRLGTMQKLKYEQNSDRVKEKIKRNYNTNPFVYGVGAYVGVGDYSLYVKYDISETFKNNTVKQNNISLGIRLDMD